MPTQRGLMMNPAAIAKHGRNLLSMVEINANRLIGRELVPIETDTIAIEPSSACNLKCVFCAYPKKDSPKISMKNDRFADYVGQAVAMGYRRFHLTPSTGDIFMDRHIFDKFKLLEELPGVLEYMFYTNFTIADADDIARLLTLKKARSIFLSVYGHDRDSFMKIAKASAKVYRRLLTNLETLLALPNRRPGVFEIAIRSTRDMPRGAATDLLKLLDRCKAAGIPVRRSRLYHSWGGKITPDDVKGLAIDVIDARKIYKSGACTLLFTGVQIMATGLVHACACIDVDAELQIGDLNEKPLREIISANNPVYMKLIEEQQRSVFPEVCQSCGFYKSIYHTRSRYRKDAISTCSIDEYKAILEDKVAAV
jgi:MoaA/NifB/PqqE/SkfB family radical SAM enzyme